MELTLLWLLPHKDVFTGSLLFPSGKLVHSCYPTCLRISLLLFPMLRLREGWAGHKTCGSSENTKAQNMLLKDEESTMTLGTWEQEGTSFCTPLDCGTEIPISCRLMVCTAQENTPPRGHSQSPQPACSSLTPGELQLLCKGGSKASITGFLLNPDETLSSTEAGR